MKNMTDEAKTIGIIAIMFILLVVSIVLFFTNNKNEIKLIDKTGDTCPEAITYFYEDETYKYYFGCQKNVYVKIDGEEYELTNALNNKLITIEKLKDLGLVYSMELKS